MQKILQFIFIFFISTSVFASSIKEFVFFGDSLSDDGNLQRILKIIPKSPPYYQGRFSNGPTWAEHVGNYFYNKYYTDYENYAYGGATAVLHDLRTDKFISPMLLQAEIDSYFLHSPFKDKSESVYLLWIGANDYLYETTDNIDKITDRVVDKISESIDRLLESGGHGVMVLNLPDLSLTPYARNHDTVQRLASISKMHNDKLQLAIQKLLIKYPNKIWSFDIYALFADLLKNPQKYNETYQTQIIDTQESCWSGTVLGLGKESLRAALLNAGVRNDFIEPAVDSPFIQNQFNMTVMNMRSPCSNADQHVFWDDLHPTAIVHKVLGQIIVGEMERVF